MEARSMFTVTLLALSISCAQVQSGSDAGRLPDEFGSRLAFTPTPWGAGEEFQAEMEHPPGKVAALFAPDLLSDGMYQRDTALSADRDHFLYTLQSGRTARILHAARHGESWSLPKVASFSGTFRDLEPAFRPGTLELYFASDRPLPGETEAGDFNLWRTSWAVGGWSKPLPILGLNGPDNEFYPSLTRTGELYFTSAREGGVGGEDLWFARADGESWFPPEPVPGGVNGATDEFNAAVDPSGSMLCFGSARADGPGGGDLYLSRRLPDGSWGEPTLLGGGVNTPQLDFCPFFDPEGDALWFTSTRPLEEAGTEAGWGGPTDLLGLRDAWQGPGNGAGDLYVVNLGAAMDSGRESSLPATQGEAPLAADKTGKAQEPTWTYPPTPGVREVAEAYLEVYLARDYTGMLPYLAEDAVFTDLTSGMFAEPLHYEGAQVIVDWLVEVGEGVESVEFLVDRSFVSGGYVVFEGTYRTTGVAVAFGHPELRMTLVQRGITTIQVEDGKVVLHHDLIDYEEMWRQLDLLLWAGDAEAAGRGAADGD